MNSPIKTWRGHKKINRLLDKIGKILSWTYLDTYGIGLIELAGGEKIMLQIVDCQKEDIKTGKKVITIVRRIGIPGKSEVIRYGIKAKLL